MNRLKLRFFAGLFSVLLFVCVFPVFAAEGGIRLTSPDAPVDLGESAIVTLTLICDQGLGAWSFQLRYDPEYLQYLSGADGGGEGTLRFADSASSPKTGSKSYSVCFRTLKSGIADVYCADTDVLNWDGEELELDSVSCVIRVPGLVGDVDGNGEIGLSDLTMLAKAVAGWDLGADCKAPAADLDEDDAVGLSDITLLAKMLAGWNVDPG